jgi:hypothetical protein
MISSMALIHGTVCGKQISDKAASCSGCGAPVAGLLTETPPPQAITSIPEEMAGGARSKRPIARPGFLVLGVLLLAIPAFMVLRGGRGRSASDPPPRSLSEAIRQPVRVVNEKVDLKEGSYMVYSFVLNKQASVQVQVTAEPKHVDVMLMTKDEAEKFREVSGKLFGGKYSYRQALSSQNVLRMDETELLPAGAWAIVVMRPVEAIFRHKATKADIVVTAY